MIALLVDGLNLIRRIHAAVPGDPGSAQHREGVLRSCERSLRRALTENAPSHAVCALDDPGPSWRHALQPQYKANRPPMPDDLLELLPEIEAAFEGLGVRCVRVAGFEADDVLASIAVKIAARGGNAVILSTDKSMLSLLREGIRVRNHFEGQDLDAHSTRQRFGVAPHQLPEYLALVGESSQGIPGVKSVGPKTAARLLAEHGDLDGVLEAAREMAGNTGTRLREDAANARLSLRLATLDSGVEVGLNLSECRVGPDEGR